MAHPISLLFTILIIGTSPSPSTAHYPHAMSYASLCFLMLQQLASFATSEADLASDHARNMLLMNLGHCVVYSFAFAHALRARSQFHDALPTANQREFLFSSIPFLSFTGLLNIFYFSAPFLSCVLENYSPTENLQVLCEDLDISTAPITLLINTVVFYAVFDVPLSPFFGYTRTTFHTFKMLLHHQIITAIVFGTTLLCCWTYSSVRQQATVEEYEQFAREQSLKGRDFRWWYSIFLRALLGVAIMTGHIANTVPLGARLTRLCSQLSSLVTSPATSIAPIFRIVSYFFLAVFFSFQVAFWVSATFHEHNSVTRVLNTLALLIAPIVFQTALFAYFTNPRSKSRSIIVVLALPLAYSLGGAVLSFTNNSARLSVKIAGLPTAAIYLLSSVGGVALLYAASKSRAYLSTYTDTQVVEYLPGFTASVFSVIFLSTYLVAEATSCVMTSENCETFVVAQYTLLVNTAMGFVYMCTYGYAYTASWYAVATHECKGWEAHRAFVYALTSFLTSMTFGLRPEKNILESSNYELYLVGSGIINVVIQACLWVILTLWISLCVATGMVLHVAAVDERLGDDDEENVGLLYKVCAAVLRLMAIPKRYLEVPEKELRVSSLYRMFYMFFPVITLTTNVAAVFSALIGERWMGWDQNWGIFLLLLSEALMPFSWMGSLLYAFSGYKSSLKEGGLHDSIVFGMPPASCVMGMLFFGVQARWWGVGIWTFVLIPTVIMAMVARKSKRVLVQTLDAKGLKEHAVNVGVAGLAALPPLILFASQTMSCMVTDFYGARGGENLSYTGNCDSIQNSNKCISLLFVFAVFSFCCFAPTSGHLNAEMIVNFELSTPDLISFLTTNMAGLIALFLFSVGGGFGEELKDWKRGLVFLFCTMLFVSIVVRLGGAYWREMRELGVGEDKHEQELVQRKVEEEEKKKSKLRQSLWHGGLKGIKGAKGPGTRKESGEGSKGAEGDEGGTAGQFAKHMEVLDVGFM
ncbi:hypothetical protein TeGR_g10553 [Tetraparma gracilis]|uniref:Uncharacterized protein n=1 Tax=Tetraparma gracilis TaxID=2962635 RepID=A0ABQ6MP65_9STRA|nr:hypothetical protein TeGR_g10553 [Tetraparma gracilis]